MASKSENNRQRLAPMLMATTLLAGVVGFVVQFMPDGTLLTFMVCVAAIGSLSGSRKVFDERENQLLGQSYAAAFEYLFFVIYLAFAFVVLAGWLHFAGEVIAFLNAHWIGLLASTMCILLGMVGIRNFREMS